MGAELERLVRSVEAALVKLLAEQSDPRVQGLKIEKCRLDSRWSEFLSVFVSERDPRTDWIDLVAQLNEIEQKLQAQFREQISIHVVWPAKMLGVAGAKRVLQETDALKDCDNFRSVKLEGDQDD